MNGLAIILVLLGIIIGVAVLQDGWDGFKSNWFGSSIDSTKTIWNTGKNAIKSFKDGNETEMVEIGKLPCATNEDCNTLLSECENACTCYDDGYCRR